MGEAIRSSSISAGDKPLASRAPQQKDKSRSDLSAVNGLRKKWSFGRVKEFFRDKELARKAQTESLRVQFLKDSDEYLATRFATDEHDDRSISTLSTLEESSTRPKQIKKSRGAQALRGHAWDLLQAGKSEGRAFKRSLTDTATQLRQAAKQALQDGSVQLQQSIQHTARKLRDIREQRHIQEARKLSDDLTPEVLEEAKAKLAQQERYRNKLVGVCIPKEVRASMHSSEVLPFLKRVATGRLSAQDADASRQQDMVDLVAHNQRAKTGLKIQILPRAYAKGLLDCHAALDKDPGLFGKKDVKANWLPAALRPAFQASGMREPRDWLMKLNSLRNDYNDIKRLQAKGQLTANLEADLRTHCQDLKVPYDIVTNKSIKLNHAFSYMTAWESAYDNREFTQWVGFGGKVKPLDPAAQAEKPSRTAVSAEKIFYYTGKDEPELKSRAQLMMELGADTAANFSPKACERFVDSLLVEVFDRKLASDAILDASVTVLDLTFDQDESGKLSVSYLLRAKNGERASFVVQGQAELNRKGEPVPGSKIEVSVVPGKVRKAVQAEEQDEVKQTSRQFTVGQIDNDLQA